MPRTRTHLSHNIAVKPENLGIIRFTAESLQAADTVERKVREILNLS